jgi:hypothetical protein
MRIVVCLFLGFLFFGFVHKYFHSHATLRTNNTSGQAEAEVELFWHDLEHSLSKESDRTISIKSVDFSSVLESYFSRNFQLLRSTGEKVNAVFIGYEIHADEIEVFIEYPGLTDFNGIRMKNELLVREFPEQVNQVTVKQGKTKKSFVFNSKTIDKSF